MFEDTDAFGPDMLHCRENITYRYIYGERDTIIALSKLS
jgi:hypothetical protein